MGIELFHGSNQVVIYPEIRKTKYTKDFSWGFYCTKDMEQAKRWASRRMNKGVVNKYIFNPTNDLKVLKFDTMNDEWLDFIANCRNGNVHDYDVVEGPMADDSIWNYVNDYLSGDIDRKVFWMLAEFKHPTHQISFHTLKALHCLKYIGCEEVYGE